MKTAISKIISIVLLNVLLVLAIGELLTRVLFYRSMNFDMEMWKYASQLKQTSSYSGVGHEHRPSKSAFLMGVQVETNSHGMRDDEVSVEKAKNTFRIVLLGDSFTMGWGVPQKNLYADLLERKLNRYPPQGFADDTKFEVLNFGVGNYNTQQEVAMLNYKGLAFQPDLVLLGYFINDAEELKKSEKNILINHSYLYAFSSFMTRKFCSQDYKNYKTYYKNLYEGEQLGWLACKKSLQDLVEISKKHRIPVVIFLIPELHNLNSDYPFTDIHSDLTQVAKGIGLPVIDLLDNFVSSPVKEQDLWVSPTDTHANKAAQPVISEALYNRLPWANFAQARKEPQALAAPVE